MGRGEEVSPGAVAPPLKPVEPAATLAPEAAIRIVGVSKSFGDSGEIRALDDVSFAIAHGEYTAAGRPWTARPNRIVRTVATSRTGLCRRSRQGPGAVGERG